MHDSGGARFAVVGILMTSAVAIFFSWYGSTDLSDRWIQVLLPADSVFPDFLFRDLCRLPFGRASRAKVMTLRLLSSEHYCRSSRRFQDVKSAIPCNCP